MYLCICTSTIVYLNIQTTQGEIYERTNSFTVNLNGYQFALTNGVQLSSRETRPSRDLNTMHAPIQTMCVLLNCLQVFEIKVISMHFQCSPINLKFYWGALKYEGPFILYDVFDLVSDRGRARPSATSNGFIDQIRPGMLSCQMATGESYQKLLGITPKTPSFSLAGPTSSSLADETA